MGTDMSIIFATIMDWPGHLSTEWFNNRADATTSFETGSKANAHIEYTLISFKVPDDATDDDVNYILDDVITGKRHLVDIDATVLRCANAGANKEPS